MDEELHDQVEFSRKAPVPCYIPPELDEQSIDRLMAKDNEYISSRNNVDTFEGVRVQVTGGPADFDFAQVASIKDFASYSGLPDIIRRNVLRMGYSRPMPIQNAAIPLITHFDGAVDLLSCAQTGTGKTAAFLLPLISSLLLKKTNNINNHQLKKSALASPAVLVIAPVRELVSQIYEEAKKFSFGTGLQIGRLYGGASVRHQHTLIQAGVDVLIATPGRLIQFLREGTITLKHTTNVVLDEADRMLDMGFIDDVRKILIDFDLHIKTCSILMFSATFPKEVQDVAREFLHPNYFFISVGQVGSAAKTIVQEVMLLEHHSKRDTLIKLIRDFFTTNNNTKKKVIVFVETKRLADFLSVILCQQMDVGIVSIHGDRTQEQRERALKMFKTGETPVLLATSVAARGLDIPQVDVIINYDLPHEVDDYVHRIGRTGRIGLSGRSISFFVVERDENLACSLYQIMVSADQAAPDWLRQLASKNLHTNYTKTKKTNTKDHRLKSNKDINSFKYSFTDKKLNLIGQTQHKDKEKENGSARQPFKKVTNDRVQPFCQDQEEQW